MIGLIVCLCICFVPLTLLAVDDIRNEMKRRKNG